MDRRENRRLAGRRWLGVGLVAAMIALVVWAFWETDGPAVETAAVGKAVKGGAVEKAATVDINDVTLYDDPAFYETDDDLNVVTMYLTVRKGNAAENTDHTWKELNSRSVFYYERLNIPRYCVEGLLQVGDESGPLPGELGYGLAVPNAIVNVRGSTSSRHPQKSYKIELKTDAGSWNDQRTIDLNKHGYETLRIRNKLAYDLAELVPALIGQRTQFVHLYVKDETERGGAPFQDYGLFTQVEQPNRLFLKNHGLDINGQFYKAGEFEFARYEDDLRLLSDPAYDAAKFNFLLEPKGNTADHSKLIAMLEDVNNEVIPIETTFEKWFDSENYFTWLAFNILVGNRDTVARNFYLYSPLNSTTWYFILWDQDGSLTRYDGRLEGQQMGNEYGICNYWGVVLHHRVLAQKKYRDMLTAKIEELAKIITPERVARMASDLALVVKPFLYAMPDLMYAPVVMGRYQEELDQLAPEISENIALYYQSLEDPMPFFIWDIEKKEGQTHVMWEPSQSLKDQMVTYSLELATDFRMGNLLFAKDGLTLSEAYLPALPPGQYFLRIAARDDQGRSQLMMHYYTDSESYRYYGVFCFYVDQKGELILNASQTEE